MEKAKPTEYMKKLNEEFPQDNNKIRMALAIALAAEANGDHEKAEKYLNKAVQEEINA